MILVIDNYDSFTYNIVQYLGQLGEKIKIIRNDAFEIDQLAQMKLKAIVLSPGPGHPVDAGCTCEVIKKYSKHIPMLGVCLGHQAIGAVEGAEVGKANEQLHGKLSKIQLKHNPLFDGLPKNIHVVRYHSLVIDQRSIPSNLEVISIDDKGEVMAIAHRTNPTYGVQFHPESISTEGGLKIFENFIKIAEKFNQARELRRAQ